MCCPCQIMGSGDSPRWRSAARQIVRTCPDVKLSGLPTLGRLYFTYLRPLGLAICPEYALVVTCSICYDFGHVPKGFGPSLHTQLAYLIADLAYHALSMPDHVDCHVWPLQDLGFWRATAVAINRAMGRPGEPGCQASRARRVWAACSLRN